MADISTRTRPERKGWDVVTYQQHIDRVKTMKSTVDCGPPRPHPLGNRREMEKRRYDNLIALDNSLMLKRLVKAVKQKSIDNEIHKSVAMHQHFNKEIGQHKRRIKLQKITIENNALLKRIQEVTPTYNRVKWEEDARRNEHHRKVMTLYPEMYKPALPKSPESAARSNSRSNSPSRFDELI
jgi:hypothetical protein